MAVTRRGVHCPGTRFARRFPVARFADVQFSFRIRLAAESYVIANHQQRRAINPGMTTLQPIQLCAHKARQHFRFERSAIFVTLGQRTLLGNACE